MTTPVSSRLAADRLTLGYGDRVVVPELSLELPTGAFTVIVGPNACGKSTLLRALARVLSPASGQVLLDGGDIASMRSKDVARRLGLLPQSPIAPETITVADLVSRGRFPHQTFLRQWSADDEAAVERALELTSTVALRDRAVDELSGGQRQRAWLAMALAQQTELLLLDEPTTFLDISHQLEVLDLCADLRDDGYTLVAVLHDLNHAARYADHLIAMRDGHVMASGSPAQVVTPEAVEELFGLPCRVIDDPETGSPLVVPAARRARQAQ